MKRTLLYFFAAACLGLLCGAGETAGAQSLGLTPAVMDATVKRGGTYSNTFTLSNDTNTRLRVRCTVTDYWYDELNRRLIGRPGSLPRSASLWVQFTPSELVIEPHTSASINAVITIPHGAAGGYYTAPTFETEDADASDPPPGTARANIKIRLQGLLLLTTEGAAEYGVEIMDGRVAPPTASSPLAMNLDVRNRGTAHARVRGVYALLDASGKLAGRGKIGEKTYLPGQRDSFSTAWAGELAPGRYTALVTLSYDRAGMTPDTLVYELPFKVGEENPAAQTKKTAP